MRSSRGRHKRAKDARWSSWRRGVRAHGSSTQYLAQSAGWRFAISCMMRAHRSQSLSENTCTIVQHFQVCQEACLYGEMLLITLNPWKVRTFRKKLCRSPVFEENTEAVEGMGAPTILFSSSVITFLRDHLKTVCQRFMLEVFSFNIKPELGCLSRAARIIRSGSSSKVSCGVPAVYGMRLRISCTRQRGFEQGTEFSE